jgi:hypothetical protein
VAGPELSASAFRLATLPLDRLPAGTRVVFKPGVPPLNVVGGYPFTHAPEIELTAPAPVLP